MSERVLHSEQWFPAPLQEVFDFFATAENLERITPPLLQFRIVTPTPIQMEVATRIDYRLKIRGLPARWTSEITAWEPPRRFVDEQLRGPYRSWIHEHRFEETHGGTQVIDRVRYRAPGGQLLHRWLIRPDLERIFAYRAQVLGDLFGTK